MIVLASYHIKGGVGKTATAVNLAHLAAQEGMAVALWDMDPQGSATFYFRVKPKVKGGGKALMAGKTSLQDLLKGTDYDNLDLIPADFSYRKLDRFLRERAKPERRIRKLLAPLAADYDLVVLDCPPGVSSVTLSVLYAADLLLVPVIPTVLSLETLGRLWKFVGKKPDLSSLMVLPFFSMADRRKRLHRDTLVAPPTGLPPFLKTVIPYASDIESMGVSREPLTAFRNSGPSVEAYGMLWTEIREKLAERGRR